MALLRNMRLDAVRARGTGALVTSVVDNYPYRTARERHCEWGERQGGLEDPRRVGVPHLL